MPPKKRSKYPLTGRQQSKVCAPGRSAVAIEQALAKAIALHQQGALQQAEKIYGEILAIHPRHAGTLHASGLLACQHGQYADAVPLFQKAIAENAGNAAYHYNLGNALKDLGRFAEAVPCYQEAQRLKPDYSEAFNNLGTVFHNQGKFDEAILACQEALRTNPNYAEAFYNLAISLQANGRLQEAIACFCKALTAKEDFPEVYDRMGRIFYEQGKLESAIGCFRQAIHIQPDVADFHFGLAVALKDQGHEDEAIVCYQQVIQLAPGFAVAYNNLGNILKEKGRLLEAIFLYNMALHYSPDYANAYGNLGSALTQTGDIEGAMASCQSALEIAPDIPEVYMLLVSLFFMTRDWAKFNNLVDTTLTIQTLSESNKNWLNLHQALQAWMDDDLCQCSGYLQAASSIQFHRPEDLSGTSRLSFYCLLKKLIDCRSKSEHLYAVGQNIPPAYVVGDSHCLSFANLSVRIGDSQYAIAARLVMGGKAYHLSKGGNNQYKAGFLKSISDIADGSPVILSFGEIDCRTDEGFYPAWMKRGQQVPIESMVRDVAEGYLDFIEMATKRRNFRLMLLGVPAPIKETCDHLTDDDFATYISIPRIWNDYLRQAVQQRGWVLLDNYALTCAEQGLSGGYYHIDARHLYPVALSRLLP